MKTKISMTVLPAIIGILLVLGVLTIYNIIIGRGLEVHPSDIKFFTIFLPFATICALIIQYFMTLPFWKIFKTKGRFLGMNLFQFTSLIAFIGGLIFGFVFWAPKTGVNELFLITMNGIVAFATYWTINLIILKRLDRP